MSLNAKERGKYFQSYTNQDLLAAIDEVKNKKMTISSISKQFNIPKTTIFNRIKGLTTSDHGKKQVLDPETERKLVEWIVLCAKMGDPRTKDQLLQAAAECSKLVCKKSKGFKNELPTSKWLSCFIKRNPAVSFRTPSSLSRASANVSKQDIINFIENFKLQLEDMLGENLQTLLKDPSAWGNCDETGFELNPVPPKVLAKKGAKNVYRVETAKPKERISVMFTFLADGRCFTPQLILKKSLSTIADIAFASGGKKSLKYL